MTRSGKRMPGLRQRGTLVASAVVGIGLLAAACGGGGSHPSGVASLGKTKSTSAAAGASVTTLPSPETVEKQYEKSLKFTLCMRSQGITNFPDPSASGGITISSGSGINPQSRQFQAAQKACQKYLPFPKLSKPQIAEEEATALKFAACMRKNGVPNYADPTFGPQGQIDERQGPGVDPNSPAFQAAAKKCNG